MRFIDRSFKNPRQRKFKDMATGDIHTIELQDDPENIEIAGTPINSENMEAFRKDIFNTIYPIGCIYITVDPLNPSTLFGGTWVTWGSGRVPVGVNTGDAEFNIVEKEYGSKTHTLTIPQMPVHTPVIYQESAGGTQVDIAGYYSEKIAGGNFLMPGDITGSGGVMRPIKAKSIGGDEPHNIIQPSIACYMFKRTA